MADKRTGSARRQRDEDSPAPKKKQSGPTQKPQKKASAKRPPVADEDESDEEEAPRPRKSSARGSARSSGGPPQQKGAGKILLLFIPGILIIVGFWVWVVFKPTPKEDTTETISFEPKIKSATEKYNQAKALFQAGSSVEGEAGVPKLEQAKALLEKASAELEEVRKGMDEIDEKAKSGDPNFQVQSAKLDVKPGTAAYDAFEDTDKNIKMLLIQARKQILERK